MIVHSYYEEDPRVRREAESLVAAGRPVVVLGLRRPDGPADSEVAGVRVQHLDVQRHQGAGLGVYLREYASFLVRAMFAAVRLHRRERFALVQVHSLPDFLVFAALPLAARRRAGAAGPARGDARVLPQPLPGRFESARPSAADAPGAAVRRGFDGDHHGQRGDARPARAARRPGREGRRRRQQPVARSVRYRGLAARARFGRTAGFDSSTRGR